MRHRAVVCSLIAACLVSASAISAGDAPARPQEAEAKPKVPERPPLVINEPFAALARGAYEDRVAALAGLLERADELAEAAQAEAARLRALPAVEISRHRQVLDFVCSALDVIPAEAAAMSSWEAGLSPEAAKISGRTCDLTCQNEQVSALLTRAGRGWGVSVSLSPAAAFMKSGLLLDLEGAPPLGEFVKWLQAEEDLVCGHVGDGLIFAPRCSAALAKKLRRKPDGAATGR
jgi:hypothetical protein